MPVRRSKRLKPKTDGPQEIPGSQSKEGRVTVSPVEAAERRKLATSGLVLGHPPAEIVSALIARFPTMTERSATDCITDARRAMQAHSSELQLDGRDRQIVRLHQHVRDARSLSQRDRNGNVVRDEHGNPVPRPNYAAVLRAEEQIARVLGTHAAVKTGGPSTLTPSQQILDLLGAMSPTELEGIIEAQMGRERREA